MRGLLLSLGTGLLTVSVAAGSVRADALPALNYTFLDDPCPQEFSLKAILTVSGAWPEDARAEVVFNYQEEAHYNAVRFLADHVEMVQVREGQAVAFGETQSWSPRAAGERIELTLKRRAWQITLLCNGNRVARAYDRQTTGGRAGTTTSADALHFSDIMLQPTEEVYFTDDFTRVKEETGVWETLSGTFTATQVRGEHADKGAPVSANRFAWQGGAAPGRGLCVAGYWFWDDYLVQANARPEAPGWIGLAALVQDAQNFVAFRWGSQAGPNVGQLIQVVAGQVTVLAEKPGGYLPGQWYQLGLKVQEGRLAGMVDGSVVCTADEPLFGQGRLGLYVEECAGVRFDDVLAEQVDGFQEDFSVSSPGKWQDVSGTWQTQTVPADHLPAAFRTRLSGEEALTVAGQDDWRNYVVGVDVKPAANGIAGLAFGVRGPQDYHLLKIDHRTLQDGQADLPQVQLVRRRGDQVTLLQEAGNGTASVPYSVPPGRWNRLKVSAWRGHLQAFINDQKAFDLFDPDLPTGPIGFYASGAGEPKFDNVYLWFPREEDPTDTVNEQFAQEASMAGWASPQGTWSQAQGMWWHLGTFFSDTSLAARFPHLAGTDGTATLLIHGDGNNPASGYALTAVVNTGGQQVTFNLLRAGQSVRSAVKSTREVPPDSVLRLYQEGPYIIGTLNDAPLVFFYDAAPLSGRQVACQAQGVDLPLGGVKAWCATMLDDTFSDAPTDWWAAQGSWEIVARWPCDARWSWLGGLDSENPVLWSKRGYVGDVTVEAWVALYMDNPADLEIGYKHPSDLNLTLCGNGRDLGSGYSCIFAGWNNTRTAILRQTEEKAATDQVKMINPSRRNLDFQRHWYYLRVDKVGNKIRYSVDGSPPLEFEDPQPLSGGQIALWTSHNNGIMAARVRVWYEQATEVQPPPVILPSLPSEGGAGGGTTPGGWQTVTVDGRPALVSDFEEGVDGWTRRDLAEGPYLTVDTDTAAHGKGSLRVTNSVTGGHFTLYAGVQQFDAVKFPRLAFAYRLSPDVKVNWYFKLNSRWHVLGFTAPDQPGASVESLGVVENVTADGAWHEAEIDLLARLREKYGDAATLALEDLSLASPKVEYLRSGIGGNPLGATYHLDHVRLTGADGTTAEDAAAVVKREM